MHANPCTRKWKLAKTPLIMNTVQPSGHAGYQVTNVDELLKNVLRSSAETTANSQSKE